MLPPDSSMGRRGHPAKCPSKLGVPVWIPVWSDGAPTPPPTTLIARKRGGVAIGLADHGDALIPARAAGARCLELGHMGQWGTSDPSSRIGRRYSDGTRVTSGFDLVGNRRFMADATGRTTSTWDIQNRLRTACYSRRISSDGARTTPPGCVECWWNPRLVDLRTCGPMPCFAARGSTCGVNARVGRSGC